MEKKNNKPEDPNKQVHSEFETTVGNNFNTVREETGKKKKEGDEEGPLNELQPDEDSVKNKGAAGEEAPKMNAPEEKKD